MNLTENICNEVIDKTTPVISSEFYIDVFAEVSRVEQRVPRDNHASITCCGNLVTSFPL